VYMGDYSVASWLDYVIDTLMFTASSPRMDVEVDATRR